MNLSKRFWDFLALREEMQSSLPVLKVKDDPKEWAKNLTIRRITEIIDDSSFILDIGAGDKRLKTMLEDAFKKRMKNYFSLDIDEKYTHDYKDIQEVKRKFDAIFLMEFLEHLHLNAGIAILEKVHTLLKPGGYIFLSTPNVEHANQLWKSNITHISHWPSRDLYAILRLIGFEKIEGYRIFIGPSNMNLKKHIKYFSQRLLCRILDLDYAHGIFFLGQKQPHNDVNDKKF